MKLEDSYHQIKSLLAKLSLRELKSLKKEIDQLVNQEETQKKERQPGVLKGEVWMAEDFNKPLDDFKDYM
jgi:hypothetical protein